MKLADFEAGLARHGAALSDWPEEARGAAEALLAVSAPARRAHREMAALDAALAETRATAPAAPDALIERVMVDAVAVAAARSRPAPPPRRLALGRFLSLPLLRPAAICAASAALGFWLGHAAAPGGAAGTLIEAEGSAAESYALGLDGEDGAVYAFLPEAEVWR